MYVAVGLGALTKGPVAVVLPGLAFAAYLIVHREPGRVREMMIPLGLIVVLAIVVPWYAVLYQRYGWTYITGFFIGENLERFTSGLGVEPDRGPLFYLPVLVSDSFPWSLFLVPAANCDAALGADVREDEITLVRTATMHEAVEALEAYAENEDADLPTCQDAA